MKTLILDTNIVSYLMKGHSPAAQYRPLIQGNLLAVSFMTAAELYEGALRAMWGAAKVSRLESIISQYVVVPSSPGICAAWARVRYERRAQPIFSEDAWIAATAVANKRPLVTHDAADFNDITGLNVLTNVP